MGFYRAVRPYLYDFPLNRLKIGFHCVFCQRAGGPNRDLCDGCESLLKKCSHTDRSGRRTHLCLSCGEESESATCVACVQRDSPFLKILAPYRYEFPIDKVIQHLKYHDRRVYARLLGSLLCSAVPDTSALPDGLLPVPMTPSRQRQRGYNQAADMARWCSDELGIACWPDGASRIADTGSLAGLGRAARQQRIVGAFRADEAVYGKRIAIVDDVLTTGATARELATELYDTGALSVELWVLARTSSAR